MSVVELIRTEPRFRWLWLSQVVSELGDWFQIIAVVSIFPTTGKGASIIAGLLVARHFVAAMTSPIAGIFADRYNRGRVMIGSDIARIAVTLGFLFVHGPEDVVLVFGLSLGLEALSMFFEPAKGAAVPQLIPPSKLYAANALSGATWSAMLAVGALTGGIAAAIVGTRTAFILNAFSFALSAVFVALARVPDLPSRPEGGGSPGGTGFREGISYLRTHPAQRSILVLRPGVLFSGGAFVLVTVFADRIFADPNSVFGRQTVLMGMMLVGRGAGALFMPFFMARFTGSNVRGLARAISIAFPLSIFGFMAFSRAPNVWLAMLALFFAHGGTSTVWTGAAQLYQVTVPNRILGRVLSIDLALVTLSVAGINAAIAALLGRETAPRTAALLLGLAFVAPFSLWLRARRKHLDALEHAAEGLAEPREQ